jgi:hypothetical protein
MSTCSCVFGVSPCGTILTKVRRIHLLLFARVQVKQEIVEVDSKETNITQSEV